MNADWEDIGVEFVGLTEPDKYAHLGEDDWNRFVQEEKREIQKRHALLKNYDEHIVTLQVLNLREELAHILQRFAPPQA